MLLKFTAVIKIKVTIERIENDFIHQPYVTIYVTYGFET